MKQKNMNRYKKILSCVLIACLCLGVIPTYVLNTRAAETEETTASTGQTLDAMEQAGYTVVTPETFGVPDASYASGETTNKEDVSLNQLLFAANVTYDGTNSGNFYYLQGTGSATVWWMQFQTGGGAIYFYNQFDYTKDSEGNRSVMYVGDSGEVSKVYGTTKDARISLYPSDFELTSFKDTEFQIWFTTEFVDAPAAFDDDDTADDVKIGIWINGKLYTQDGVDTYFYVLDCAENTYKGYLKHSARFAISSPFAKSLTTPEGYQMPEGYRVVTPLTFGVLDNTTGATVAATKTEGISLDKLLFAANVTRVDDGTTNNTYLDYLLGPAGQNICRLQMRPGDNRLYIYNYFDYNAKTGLYRGDGGTSPKAYGSNYYSMKPTEFGLNTRFEDTDLEIWITTEFARAPWLDESAPEDDLKIGIWVNGELYDYNAAGKDTYFYVLDCKENTYRGGLTTANEKLAISSPFMEPNAMGMVGGEYASINGEFYDVTTSPLLANKLMDGTTFQSSVRFEGEGGTLYYGSKDDATAIKLTSTSNGIQVSRGGENIVLLDKNKVGIDVLNKNFDLKLSTQVVNCDDDELTDDVKLGIYVNNKYRSFNLVDAADVEGELTATIGVKTDNGATVLFGDFENEDPAQVYCCLDSSVYTQEKADGVTRLSLDGIIQESDFVLDGEGTYSVAITKDGKVSLKDVVVYQSYDIIDDEVVDIKDLVRALKVKNDATREDTIAGLSIYEKRAIGYVDADTWTADFGKKVLGYMRNALLGDVTPIDQVQIDQVQ